MLLKIQVLLDYHAVVSGVCFVDVLVHLFLLCVWLLYKNSRTQHAVVTMII
jgi:hypothetical protein